MRSRQVLSVFVITMVCISLFQNCGGGYVNTFEGLSSIELDEENILSEIHVLDLKGNMGYSRVYIKKANDSEKELAVEIATSEGEFFTLYDSDDTLSDYVNFTSVMLTDVVGESRLILLNSAKNRLMELSFRSGIRSIKFEYEVDLIERVNEMALRNRKVDYEGQDRVIKIGLNKLIFSNFERSLSKTPRVVCIEGFTNVDDKCQTFSCSSGYVITNNKTCVAKIRSCSVPNGRGVQTYNTSSNSYGSCRLVSCKSGYIKNDSNCVALRRSCRPFGAVSATMLFNQRTGTYGACQAFSCRSGYVMTNNKTCVARSQQALSCRSGYVRTNNKTCVAKIRSCSVPNGRGVQTYNTSSNSYGNCRLISCNSGYQEIGDTESANSSGCVYVEDAR